MRHFHPCAGTVISLANSNFFLLQIFYNNTMRSTILFPHVISYVPTKNLRPGHCYLFCTFEICLLRSKVDLMCTVFGSLIIMNVKMTRSLCSQDYHYTWADTKASENIIRKWYLFLKDSHLFWRLLDIKWSAFSLTYQEILSHNSPVTNKKMPLNGDFMLFNIY